MAFQPREEHSNELELFVKKALLTGVMLVLAALLWFARDVVILVFIAAVLAAGISPAVHRVRVLWRHFFHRNITRGPAVLIVYFPFLIGAVLLLIIMVPRLIDDWQALSAQAPALIERNVLTPLDKYLPMGSIRAYLNR